MALCHWRRFRVRNNVPATEHDLRFLRPDWSTDVQVSAATSASLSAVDRVRRFHLHAQVTNFLCLINRDAAKHVVTSVKRVPHKQSPRTSPRLAVDSPFFTTPIALRCARNAGVDFAGWCCVFGPNFLASPTGLRCSHQQPHGSSPSRPAVAVVQEVLLYIHSCRCRRWKYYFTLDVRRDKSDAYC